MQPSNSVSDPDSEKPCIRYSITGIAAHKRIAPLLPPNWIDCSPHLPNRTDELHHTTREGESTISRNEVEFLWENAPRFETKQFRDKVRCYSHLPNGITVLDDKWALARLFQKDHATNENLMERSPFASLESHCFRGKSGFREFTNRVGMDSHPSPISKDDGANCKKKIAPVFPDLLNRHRKHESKHQKFPKAPNNLWVIKDARSNGAGGIWIVDETNSSAFVSETSPLIEDHRYVAQQYAWPPVLYGGRKCHVRVYAMICSDGSAFVHKKAFLHVANEMFGEGGHRVQNDLTNEKKLSETEFSAELFDSSVHITNCCANSHDVNKFSGEICADLDKYLISDEEHDNDDSTAATASSNNIPLAEFYPSISSSVSTLAKKVFPFVQGGKANNGFEYLGLDFILSYYQNDDNDRDGKNDSLVPIAYLLEVNSPPSQDTATGLPHAENLHNEVIHDLINMWVVPKVTRNFKDTAPSQFGNANGWKCVIQCDQAVEKSFDDGKTLIAPSKAAILNKIRWAIFERKSSRIQRVDVAEPQLDERVKSTRSKDRNDVITLQNSCISMDKKSSTDVSQFARKQFPYFNSDKENGFGDLETER